MRTAIFVTNIVAPYRISFLNTISEDREVQLKVFYAAEQEKNRLWHTYFDEIKYDFGILRGFHIHLGKRTLHINYGLIPRILRIRPDVIIIGTDILSTPISWVLLVLAKILKIRVIRFESQHKYTVSPRSLKKIFYKLFYSYVDNFFVYSQLTKEYLVELGVNINKIVVGYNVGDTNYFLENTRKYSAGENYIKERQQYPAVLYLFSGRLTKSKNILLLLSVLREIDLADIGLVILGDGELKMETMAAIKKLQHVSVFYKGFIQKDECIKFFSLSDIFVLPTLYDRASIVVSEALFSGLFTIGSKYDGSSTNFICDGENGLVIDPVDKQQLKSALIKAYQMKKERKLNKEQIRASMEKFALRNYAQRLASLIKQNS